MKLYALINLKISFRYFKGTLLTSLDKRQRTPTAKARPAFQTVKLMRICQDFNTLSFESLFPVYFYKLRFNFKS